MEDLFTPNTPPGGVRLFVDLGGKRRDTVNIQAMQQDDTSHQASDRFASSTPEKQESKKRPNIGIDLNQKPRQKPKRHRPKILDESIKRKTPKVQVSEFQPKTPLKRSTPKPRAKRSHVRKNSSKQVSDPSEDAVQGHVPNRSCRRALHFNLVKEAEVEAEHGDEQVLNLTLDKRFVKKYQRRQNIRMDNPGLNMEKPTSYPTPESISNATPESNITDTTSLSSQDTVHSSPSQVVCGSDSSFFPKIYKQRRNVRHMVNNSWGTVLSPKTALKNCVTRLPSFPIVWKRKRSLGSTKRRLYASRPIRFLCSPSLSVNLLEHLIEEKHHCKVRLQDKKKDMKGRHNKVNPSPKNQTVKMIKDYIPQECLIKQKDPNVHSIVDFIVAKFDSLSIDEKHDERKFNPPNEVQAVVDLEKKVVVDLEKKVIVPEEKFNPQKKVQAVVDLEKKVQAVVDLKKKVQAVVVPKKKVQAVVALKKKVYAVDLDEASERAWPIFVANGGSSNYDGQDSEYTEYWDRERQIIRNRAESLVSILRDIQGDRRFSRWKGSVMDSIIGAFLTQNVADHLSSSAYMSLAAQFPVRDLKGSNRSSESVPPCLHIFPQVAGTERSGNRTSQEIDHCASTSENERTVACSSTRNKQAIENESSVRSEVVLKKKKIKYSNKNQANVDWDNLRKKYTRQRVKNDKNMDGTDWQSVKRATVVEVAECIKNRGMHNILAKKIKAFLDRAMQDHGSMDLEWLRDVPPKDAKDYLLSIDGLGLKSTECIRLLTLHHVAFPVDVNVGRVAVRLGWVPLQPLPEGVQMHLLKVLPLMDDIQKYLYPRLYTLNHETLYELHYHLITFGKIFCTQKNPRCERCPLKGQCKYYASLSASKRVALPAPASKNKTAKSRRGKTYRKSNVGVKPVVEMPASPEHHIEELQPEDIEDLYQDRHDALPNLNVTPDCPESDDDILTLRLGSKAYDMSQVWAVPPVPSATPVRIYRERLKSVHLVYELGDSHGLLEELQVDARDPDDTSPYLFVPWEEVLIVDGVPLGKPRSSSPQDCSSLEVCGDIVCLSNNEDDDFTTTVSGTLLIPVRTATKGRFPLNGTYFQVNEVFADDKTSHTRIVVPKIWLNPLPRSLLYCGAGVSSTFKEMPLEHMCHAFAKGYYCGRGFNRETKYTTELSETFHIKTSKQKKR